MGASLVDTPNMNAQAILNLFPDSISQYGLIGCGISLDLALMLCVVAFLARALWRV
jgi:hypothetical protein